MPISFPSPPDRLVAEVARQTSRPVPDDLGPLVDALGRRFGESLDAVLLYGSRLHADAGPRGIVDLFVVVDSYANAYRSPVMRAFNRVLPPNVFYFEVGDGEGRLQAKYSVFSAAHLAAGTSRWFHSYVWARLAQPCRLLWARDEATRSDVHRALARAVLTFHDEVAPVAAGKIVASRALWKEGLSRTYSSELRPEGSERAAWLVERNGADYERLSATLGSALDPGLVPDGEGRFRIPGGAAEHRRARLRWGVRRVQGKVLSVLRLGKSALTFASAADYVVAKIERHTGTALDVPPWVRRHPFLSAPFALVALLARRVIR